jgi:hypothetical protein
MDNKTPKKIEIVAGALSNRGKFIDIADATDYMHLETEVYRSMFLLDDSIDECKSIKDYKGVYALDRILFDFDIKDDGNALVKEVLNFHSALIERGANKDLIQIWFSGRGFHVIIPDYYGFEPSKNLPAMLKETLKRDFKGYNIDLIYDNARIIRLEYTINNKSNLYKIPIMYDSLKNCTYENVCELAKKRDDVDISQLECADTQLTLGWDETPESIWSDKKAKRIVKETPTIKPSNAKIGTKYNGNVTCVQKMADSSFEHGRNNTLLRMAVVWKNVWGLNKDQSLAIARATIPNLPESERNNQIARVYDDYEYKYRCDDHIMSSYCDTLCKFYQAKNFGVSVKTPKEVKEEYIQRLLQSRTEFNLRDVWDIGTDYIMEEGQFIVVIADTGVGKSAWLQNLSVSLKEFKILYITLEMPSELLLCRFFQISHNQTYEAVKSKLTQDHSVVDEYLDAIKHIRLMDSQPNIESMKELVVQEQPDIVMVDTMDKIIVHGVRDNMRKMEQISYNLQRLAIDTKTIVIGVAHISRGATKDERGRPKPLDVHSAKDSSSIEQNADKLILIDGTRKSPIKIVSDGKTRTGNGFRVEMKMIGETFKYELVNGSYGKDTQKIGRARISQR